MRSSESHSSMPTTPTRPTGTCDKLTAWLKASDAHYLVVLAYNDAVALLNGKPFVSASGGTWGRSHQMIDDLKSALPFTSEISGELGAIDRAGGPGQVSPDGEPGTKSAAHCSGGKERLHREPARGDEARGSRLHVLWRSGLHAIRPPGRGLGKNVRGSVGDQSASNGLGRSRVTRCLDRARWHIFRR